MGDFLAASRRSTIPIGGMQCSFCSTTLTKGVARLQGINEVHVNLGHGEMFVDYIPELVDQESIEKTVKSLGYTVRDRDKLKKFDQAREELRLSKRIFIRSLFFSLGSLILLVYFKELNPTGIFLDGTLYLSIALALLNVFYIGHTIVSMAYGSLRRGIFNQHVLMEFASIGGLIGGFLGIYYGYPPIPFFAIASFIASYHLLGAYLSTVTRTQSDEALLGLMALQPDISHLIMDGGINDIETNKLEIGNIVEVRPGERIPVDGIVRSGTSSVDQSLVTGESIPVDIKPNMEVISGSMNLNGTLRIEVTQAADQSFISRVVKNVQEARAIKPGIIQLLDKILKYFVPLVLGAASLAFAVWIVVPYITTGDIVFEAAIYAAVSALILGYPCALGMSTPLAMERAYIKATKKGILFRSPDSLYVIKTIDTLLLDKTGTVTEGKLAVGELHHAKGVESEWLLNVIEAMESHSNHPIAKSLVAFAEEQGAEGLELDDFREISGTGLKGKLSGRTIEIGNIETTEGKIFDNSLENEYQRARKMGNTMVFISDESRVLAFVELNDRIRSSIKDLVKWCKANKIQVSMLTGDSRETAKMIAGAAGITSFEASLKPEDKMAFVRRSQSEGRKVAFIGDGINDAPSITQSDLGIAVGTGTDITKDSSDVIFMKPDPSNFIQAREIGKSGYAKTAQNLSIAFGVNIIGLALSVAGLITPVYAMIAMISSASIVLLNSLGSAYIVDRLHRNPA